MTTCAPTYRPMPRVGAGARRRRARLPSGGHGPARRMDLSGTWRARPADDEPAPHAFFELDLDDRQLGARRGARPLAHARRRSPTSDGPLLYRRRFELTRRPASRARAAGSCSTASSTRATCGSTAPTSATPRATSSPTRSRSPSSPAAGTEHVLAVEVACAPHERSRPPSATSPACSSTGTASTPTGTPAASGGRSGSSAPGPVRIAPPAGAVPRGRRRRGRMLALRAVLDSRRGPHGDRCARRSAAAESSVEQSRSPRGENHVEWTCRRRQPRAVVAARARRPAAARRRRSTVVGRRRRRATPGPVRTGLRQVAMRNWMLSRQRRAAVPQGREPGPDPHGARRGDAGRAARATSHLAARRGPRPVPRPRPRQPARALRRRRRGRAARCGRTCRCSGATPAASASRRSARPREAVDLLGHHPSIALWCGHNEPVAVDVEPPATRRPDDVRAGRSLAGQELPTWNKTMLDRSVKRAFERADGTPARDRPLRRAAPPAQARRHRQPPLLRLVPRRRARPPALRRRACPRMARFVSEFGAQAVPDDADVLRARALARSRLGAAGPPPRAAEGDVRPARAARRRTPPSTSGGAATQAYQATVV